MSFLLLLWLGILGVMLLVYLAYPLFRGTEFTPEYSPAEVRMQTLAIEREQSYSALIDLDDDYESGKLSEEDYKELRAALLQETAQIVSQLEAAAQSDVESEIERYKRDREQ
ncbi:hypothetical protein JT359_00030 [Candidatus Poribacteria bacterium]|nr:hypothetical protein [Candidatus Poribacteria bacterium]